MRREGRVGRGRDFEKNDKNSMKIAKSKYVAQRNGGPGGQKPIFWVER